MEVKEKEKKVTGKPHFVSAIARSVKEGIAIGKSRQSTVDLWINIAIILLGALLGGCHAVFGAYPFGLALVCALPFGVWLALIGVSLGSLMLGRSGVVYVMACILAALLRVIISSGAGKGRAEVSSDTVDLGAQGESGGSTDYGNAAPSETSSLFSESVALRTCCAVICGFICGLYEVLLLGFKLETVLYGASMIVGAALAALVLCGAFYKEVGVRELIFGGRRIFALPDEPRSRARLILFEVCALILLLLVSLSLRRYRIFGIDLPFVFAAAITLFAAKRFGSLYGAAVGFVSSVGISGLYSSSFMLLGIGAGLLFPFGTAYAALGGGILLSLWGAYASGVGGFLSVFPEYLIGACLIAPAIRHIERDKSPDKESDVAKRRATDMVGTMALAYRNGKTLAIEELELSMSNFAPIVSDFCENEIMSESYVMMSRLISEAKLSLMRDRELDEDMTDAVEAALEEYGFNNGVARAFGTRRKYIICAAQDRDGVRITSPAFLHSIENASGLRLTSPEYYRREDMVVMECEAAARYELRGGYAKEANDGGEVSGDTVSLFESKDLFAYGLISDGMGSGEEARRTSEFVARFLKAFLGAGLSYTTVIHMLNLIVRRNREECGATLDLFSLDMISGEGTFIKSGAVPSYIKRDGSLFRIKSQTMPLGFIKQVDAEKTSATVREGDLIIMTSDGVCQVGEDAPWLIDALNSTPDLSPKEYAQRILRAARASGKGEDDMSVLVMRLCKKE